MQAHSTRIGPNHITVLQQVRAGGAWHRGGTVLAIAGDAAAGKRGDARLASRALAAAKEAGAGRFVLITPQGGAASGGGLFGLFGGGGGSGGRSKLEQEVRLPLPNQLELLC